MNKPIQKIQEENTGLFAFLGMSMAEHKKVFVGMSTVSKGYTTLWSKSVAKQYVKGLRVMANRIEKWIPEIEDSE